MPAAVAAPPAQVLPPTPLGARAEDTGKCKRFYPEGCASNSYVKKCRKSCHEEYPLMKYCKSYVSEDKFAELKAEFEALKLATYGPEGREGREGRGRRGRQGTETPGLPSVSLSAIKKCHLSTSAAAVSTTAAGIPASPRS